MGLLDGQVALITGAGWGQGRAHAVTSAREGADVILIDIAAQVGTVPYKMATPADLDETARLVTEIGRKAVAVEGDVRSQEALGRAVEEGVAQFGKIDILIANAGIWTTAPFWELTEQQWSDMIEINLGGVWRSAKAVAAHMMERRSGSMVLISSVKGSEPGVEDAHYTAAKHGVIGLMKNIALEMAPYRVRCNAVSPGAVRSPMMDNPFGWNMFAGREGGTADDMVEAGFRWTALAGTGFLEPQAIADAALYLNSPLAATVTGLNLVVDAGHLLLTGFNHKPVRE